jgi:hypothetical protein
MPGRFIYDAGTWNSETLAHPMRECYPEGNATQLRRYQRKFGQQLESICLDASSMMPVRGTARRTLIR